MLTVWSTITRDVIFAAIHAAFLSVYRFLIPLLADPAKRDWWGTSTAYSASGTPNPSRPWTVGG
jgi:hypothetical protein